MDLKQYFPFWADLTDAQRGRVSNAVQERTFPKGAVVHDGASDCLGLLAVVSGQLRVYTVSEEGKEVTLFRLLKGELCLFTAACILNRIDFELIVEAWDETTVLILPAAVYKELIRTSLPVSNVTNDLMAERFSDVIWLLDQVMNQSFDRRLAAFLLEESRISGGDDLRLTHEAAAHHMGSAREVVTRMLKYFQSEGLVSLSRGGIRILDHAGLKRMAGDSIRRQA